MVFYVLCFFVFDVARIKTVLYHFTHTPFFSHFLSYLMHTSQNLRYLWVTTMNAQLQHNHQVLGQSQNLVKPILISNIENKQLEEMV